jgi:5-methylcytosine-specific restriction protein A
MRQSEVQNMDEKFDSTWSKGELKAAVEAYVDMQRKARSKQSFIKKHYYKDLADKFGRTEKSFEYRMQNISYVLSLMGREWLTGLKPAKNVGSKNAAEIELLITEIGGLNLVPVAEFEIEVRTSVNKNLTRPVGNIIPQMNSFGVTQFQRDTNVKAWVLQQAKGICELCGQQAPFNNSDGIPYLEIHHIRQLADKGSDTVTNAVAVCPNCHKELHYGENSQILAERLYKQITRLIRE